MLSSQRFDRLDALRGVAIVWMAAVPLLLRLEPLRLLHAEAGRSPPIRSGPRSARASSRCSCSAPASGQAIALEQGQSWSRFWRRWAQIAGCAVLVSAGSAWMFPRSWISFGVLHGIAVMLILVRWMAPLRAWLWLTWCIGDRTAAAVAQRDVQRPVAALDRTGHPKAENRRLRTGAAVAGCDAVGHGGGPVVAVVPARLAARVRSPRAARGLALLGRWSLSFYMVHQPVLIGLVMAAAALRR